MKTQSSYPRGRSASKFLMSAAVAGAIAALGLPALAADESKPDPAAEPILAAARQAYGESRYDVAADRFGEYLRRFGGYANAPAAHYGLGVSLLLRPDGDINVAATELAAAAKSDLPVKPFALHYLAVAERQQADALAGKPEAAAKLRSAAEHFDGAAALFAKRSKAATDADGQWQIQARLDAADVLVRLGTAPEGKSAAASLAALMKSEGFDKSRFLPRARYLLGNAEFNQGNYLAAGRSLALLSPFGDPEFGLAARYLLARSHELSGERPEALAVYRSVIAEFANARNRANEMLRNAGALTREQRQYYTAIANSTPDYVNLASLYAGAMLARSGKNADAQDLLVKLMRNNPGPAILAEAQLWQGVCQLQAKNYNEAAGLLEPLRENASFGDQAQWWAARARGLAADPSNAAAYGKAMAAAVEQLQKAADRAGALAKAGDAAAAVRRADILLDLAETQLLARQQKDAAATYGQIAAEFSKSVPDRAEQALERQVSALHLAGDYAASDAVAAKFKAAYPKSTLMAGVAFREAENAYLPAVAGAGNPALLATAAACFKQVVDAYPDFQYANVARAGLGMCLYRQGKFDAAVEVLGTVPEPDRIGDLASVNYVLADCLIRDMPDDTPDALSASRLLEDAARAAKLLVTFAAGNDKNPQAGEAVLKAALCYERLAGVIADPVEQRKYLTQAREMLERAANMLPRENPNLAVAVIDRAAILAQLSAPNVAIDELRNFDRAERLKGSVQAPLAALRLATLLRASGRAAEAVPILDTLRQQQEASREPARTKILPAIIAEQAVALKESGKPAEARALLAALTTQFRGSPEAVSVTWRLAQMRREELFTRIAEARKNIARGGNKPDPAATRELDESIKALRQAAEDAQLAADGLGTTSVATKDAATRLRYEAAWCLRGVADVETEAARKKFQADYLARVSGKIKDRTNLRAPEPGATEIPLQPGEAAVRAAYQRLIDADETSAVAVRARLELAELFMPRGENDPALELLADAISQDPPEELAERIRLRMAACWIARGDPESAKAALATVKVVLLNNRSALRGEALYYNAEALIAQRDLGAAADVLRSIRDNPAFASIPGISDRALYRLAYVQRELGKKDDANQFLADLTRRYSSSPWAVEAQFQLGQLYQGLKNYDPAINAYADVTRRAAPAVAANAQLQIGLIRLEQRNFPEAARALVLVRAAYDCPELAPQALVEAARAYVELKQPAEARKLLNEVITTAPKSQWAQVAEKRLTEIK